MKCKFSVLVFWLSLNGHFFKSHCLKLRDDLLHPLPLASVLVLDNASFHKRQDLLEVIEEKGHTVEFLPLYSPGLHPIEHKWAQAKAIRRKQRCILIRYLPNTSIDHFIGG